MFFTYVARELRRRKRQALIVSLGLALGIGLVVTVAAMATGVRQAQSTVLQSLYGVGTDITVTQPAARGSGPGAQFGLNPGQNQQGQEFSRDRIFASPGLGTMSEDDVTTVGDVSGVDAAAGGISLTSVHLEGEFADFGGFGQGQGPPAAQPTAQPSVPPIQVTTYSITGVDVTNTAVGPLSPSQVTTGRSFTYEETDAKVAVLDASYAKQKKLKVGSTITISGTKYEVIGIATPASGAESSNVYIPLSRAQNLADADGEVTRIYVKATSASAIDSVQAGIEEVLPKATVTTADDLASEVTGSLSSASTLSGNLGKWLSVAGLIAAFAVASLLTFGAVGRRTREFGTLKALGWRSRRVVGQVMGESVVQGLLGGILGIAFGIAGAYLVSRFFPSLQATVGAAATPPAGGGFGGPPGGGAFGRALAGQTVSVPLKATVEPMLVLVAIGLALLGGVIAGSLGGWRAARLRPAEALRRVE